MIFAIEGGRLLPSAEGLSAEQAQALTLDRHVVVTAGAGSGKTRTLSRRYLRILGDFAWRAALGEDPRGPESILVSTFTERAAAEMKERIRAELVLGIRELREHREHFAEQVGAARHQAVLRHLQRCLREFERARIGTFHGFCGGLLREFAAAASLDPGFEVLADTSAEVQQAVATALARLDAGDPAFLPLIDTLGRRRTAEALAKWIDKRDELRDFGASLEGDADLLVQRWAEELGGLDLAAMERAMERLRPLLEDLASMRRELRDGAPPVLAAAAEALQWRPEGEFIERAGSLAAAVRRFMNKDGFQKESHVWVGKKNSMPAALREDLLDTWREARELLESAFGPGGALLQAMPSLADRLAMPALRALEQLTRVALEAYAELKAGRRALDFADLQLRLRDLLDLRPDLADAISARFEHILVDEFQDTNALQWGLVKRLLGDPRPDAGLFLVGDPKQAIYRFRGGDVTIFDRAIDELGDPLRVAFSANFRSRPALIDAFNHLFGWLLAADGPERPPWEAAFEPLAARRDGEAFVDVHWIAERKPSSEQVAADTARLAAILPGLLAETPPHEGRQVAVLLKRRTNLAAYARALREAGVPHVVAGGRNFFARQEILDVGDLLLALSHPDDGVSLLGCLRGPFLALEDAWLLWLARCGGHGPDALRRGWDRVRAGLRDPERRPEGWAQLPPEGRHALGSAGARFERWSSLRRRLPLSALLRRILTETSAAHLFARQDPTGQVLANLEKLLALAVEFDARGTEGAADFGLFLREQDQLGVDEGEAALDATAPVVLMTVHGSKGLEFPAVVLPDLNAKIAHGEASALAIGRVDGRWVAAPKPTLTLDGTRAPRDLLLRHLLKRQVDAEERAEAKRVLYVACTRARDRLVLLLPEGRYARGVDDSVTWSEWLRSWIQVGPALRELRDVESVPLPRAEATAPPELDAVIRALTPLPRSLQQRVLPHELVPDEPPRESGADEPPGEPGVLGRLRGILVHGCLEDGITAPSAATAARADVALAQAGLLDDTNRRWLRTEVAEHLSGYRAAAPEADLAYREVGFRLPLPDGAWLEGVIDLLYRDPANRRWVVLDYKSNRGPVEALAEHYRAQLVAYAWAASRILPEVRDGGWPVSGELLFTGHGQRVEVFEARDGAALEAELQALRGLNPG